MAKLTQTEIKMLADEWAACERKLVRAAAAQERDLAPHNAAYAEAITPILEKYDPKRAKLEARRDEIVETVTEWLLDHGRSVELKGVEATAANVQQVAGRKIDAETFFDRIKDRSSAFWGCVTIAIQKADKYLGKDNVDELATRETRLVPTLKLN